MTPGTDKGFTGIPHGFRDVDAVEDPDQFGRYLARVAEMIATDKQQIHDLLEPAPGQRLLDVGCGLGDDVRALAASVAPTGSVVGIDLSASLIDDARKQGRAAGVEFLTADAHELPFSDATFHGARVERALQHVADPGRVLSEMARVVRPGGIVIASEPDWGTLTVDGTERAATRKVIQALCDEHIRNGWIGRQLVGYFTRAGLEATEVRPITLVIRSLPVAVDILGLADAASRATDWFADLQQRERTGSFFASITGFTVKGRASKTA
jgi:ubiquinone/menaquinone biosynthesis C-methylase UbiE